MERVRKLEFRDGYIKRLWVPSPPERFPSRQGDFWKRWVERKRREDKWVNERFQSLCPLWSCLSWAPTCPAHHFTSMHHVLYCYTPGLISNNTKSHNLGLIRHGHALYANCTPSSLLTPPGKLIYSLIIINNFV